MALPPQSFRGPGPQSPQVRDRARLNLGLYRGPETRFLSESDRIASRFRLRFRDDESGTRNGPPYPESGYYVPDTNLISLKTLYKLVTSS